MAKTQKYSEDKLLEAVVKFSEIEKKKIKATELAKWCRDNIEGLEEVRDYHFTRSVKEKDERTGKMVERPKRCTLKIEEINKSRSLIVSINKNLLLQASNIDIFMEQPDSAKRKMIVETRETVDKLLMRNRNITREKEVLKTENQAMKAEILKISEKVDNFQKTQDKLIRQIKYLMKVTDEAARKEIVAQMGISDDSVDLDTYMNSLNQELSQIVDINRILRKYLDESDSNIDSKGDKADNLINDIMSGLDF